MSWRPDNWGNPYTDLTEEAITEKYLILALEEPKSDYEIFEAGADAMLEALRERNDQRTEEITGELDRVIVLIEGLDDI